MLVDLVSVRPNDYELVFELGEIYADIGMLDKSLTAITMAINTALNNLLNINPQRLGQYYLMRASVFEFMGMF